MVSNMDTKGRIINNDDMHTEVANQSEDEILDYLMGSEKNAHSNTHQTGFDALRQNVQKSYKKIKQKAEKPKKQPVQRISLFNSMLTGAGFLQRLTLDGLQLTVAKLQFAYSLASKFNTVEHFRPAKAFIEKLNNTEIANIDLSPEQMASIKVKMKPLGNKIKQISDKSIELIGESKDYATEKLSTTNEMLTDKFPNYKQQFVSTVVLIGCGLMTFVSQLAVQAPPKEDLLSMRRLSAVNWNVNGHVTDVEKDSIKNMIATGQIKVLPKAKISNSSVRLVTTTSSLANEAASPDDSFMQISSNTVSHTVNQGESVLSISQKYKVSISDLISSNPERDLIDLKPGDHVVVPNTMEVEAPIQLNKNYRKVPRNLLASRSASRMSRAYNFTSYPTTNNNAMIWPVPASRKISSGYGPRWGGFHPGVDITAPIGTPIIATKDGVVISSGWEGGYGKCVIIDHGNGISTRYAHASALMVRSGQAVKAGQIVARMGSTGWSTGSHLHYEVLINGRHHNPMRYF